MLQTPASSQSRIDLTVSDSRISTRNCNGAVLRALRTEKKISRNHFYPGYEVSSVEKMLLPITFPLSGERESRCIKRRLRNAAFHDVTPSTCLPPSTVFPFSLYYLETAAWFMQTRKLDRILGTTVSDRKRDCR